MTFLGAIFHFSKALPSYKHFNFQFNKNVIFICLRICTEQNRELQFVAEIFFSKIKMIGQNFLSHFRIASALHWELFNFSHSFTLFCLMKTLCTFQDVFAKLFSSLMLKPKKQNIRQRFTHGYEVVYDFYRKLLTLTNTVSKFLLNGNSMSFLNYF